jgi:hypothetical protein
MDFRTEQMGANRLALIATEGDWEDRFMVALDEAADIPIETALRQGKVRLERKYAERATALALDYNTRLAAILAG